MCVDIPKALGQPGHLFERRHKPRGGGGDKRGQTTLKSEMALLQGEPAEEHLTEKQSNNVHAREHEELILFHFELLYGLEKPWLQNKDAK